MQRIIFLFCGAVWLIFLSLDLVCSSSDKHQKCSYDKDTDFYQRIFRSRKFCDPSSNNQTRCSSGFYRETIGPNRGQCVPCSCNGLSKHCDQQTGDCENCQSYTTGRRCERCKGGYYGNAANRTCRACPCPNAWNNFALACLDVGSGVLECLCKQGYSGARCERCSFGFYGDPEEPGGSCRPCNCKNSSLHTCDHLTGECKTLQNSSSADHCHNPNGCPVLLLHDLKNMDDDLVQLTQQLLNISDRPVSLHKLEHKDNTSQIKSFVQGFISAVKHLDTTLKQLEDDVDSTGEDLSQLIDETLKTSPDLEKLLQKINRTELKLEDFLTEAAALLTGIRDLINQLPEEDPSDSDVLPESDKVMMMDEAEQMMEKIMVKSCRGHRDRADKEHQDAHTLLDLIRSSMTRPAGVMNQTEDFLMEISELLSDARDNLNRTERHSAKSSSLLQHLKHLQAQLDRNQSTHLVADTTKDLLKNITNNFLGLEEVKEVFEFLAAQINGAKLELFKRLNNIFNTMGKDDLVMKAEEHAEELHKEAAEIQQGLHDVTNRTDLQTGAQNSLMNVLEKAEMEANRSRVSADGALRDVKDGGLVKKVAALRNDSTQLWRDAQKTQKSPNGMKTLTEDVNWKNKKGESLKKHIFAVQRDLKTTRRDDTDDLINSVKAAAAAAKSTVTDILERVKRMSEQVDKISSNISKKTDDMLKDADQTLSTLNTALPQLTDKITTVEALGRMAPPSGNMTENLRRIKELIEETRTFVQRLSAATTFNGKSHVELHPPKNLEDIKAFTAVDLLLSVPEDNSSRNKRGRRRRDKHKEHNAFVLYLGSKNSSGDFIGMAIRNKVLVCVYRLNGVVHEVETSQITERTNEKSEFDRVIFHRVYQDAEVNITQNFMSQRPINLPPKHHRPNTRARVLDLDPKGVVFYVGGHPQNFRPPEELHYPKFRGVIKLSYINDYSVSLFNYKRAANLEAKQPAVKIPQSDVSDYYEGTGYRLVFIKEPNKSKTRLFRFHTHSRETNALIFFIENQESFFCLFMERGFLVLQGQQAGRQIHVQSDTKVSLFDKSFSITAGDKLTVHYGPKQISADHIQTNYSSFYIGGLPDQIRQRYDISAPALRGCVDHLTADAQTVEYNRTIGVSKGCLDTRLGVRTALLSSPLSVDPLLDQGEKTFSLSVSFKTSDTHGSLLKSSSEGLSSVRDLQLTLSEGFVVFSDANYTLKSDQMYNDGKWHHLSAEWRTNGLELLLDNSKVIQRGLTHEIQKEQSLQGGKFKGCISNLYIRRPRQCVLPVDLSSLSLNEEDVLGQCDLRPQTNTPSLPEHVTKKTQEHRPTQAPATTRCQRPPSQLAEYQLLQDHSWIRYTLPQDDLSYRPHFSFNIKTLSSKGLILHVAGRGVIPLLALYMANGKIKMSLGHDRIIYHKQKSNDGEWHRVDFSIEKSSFHLLVDGVRVTDGHLPNDEGSSLDLMNPVYLGGDPTGRNTKGHNIPMNSVVGCLRDFKMNDEVIEEPEEKHQILPCPDGLTEMGAYFGGGHIVKDHFFPLSSQFVLSFELRPEVLAGVLFHVQSHKSSFYVALMENEIFVRLAEDMNVMSLSVNPSENLCDGNFHVVTVSRQNNAIKLEVDLKFEQKKIIWTSTSPPTKPETLYIGGTSQKHKHLVSSSFSGCLRNTKLNGLPVSFDSESAVIHPVSVNGCPAG